MESSRTDSHLCFECPEMTKCVWFHCSRCYQSTEMLYSHAVKTRSSGFLWKLSSRLEEFPIKIPTGKKTVGDQMRCVQRKPKHKSLKSNWDTLIRYFQSKTSVVDAAETRVQGPHLHRRKKERFPLTAKHLLTPINSYSCTLTARENALGFFCSTAIWKKYIVVQKKKKIFLFVKCYSQTRFQCTWLTSICWAVPLHMDAVIQGGVYHLHIPATKWFQD